MRSFLAPLLRPPPSPKSKPGFWGYLLLVLTPILGFLTHWGNINLVAENIHRIEYALSAWWGYPLLFLFGVLLLLYAGYKQPSGQQPEVENVAPADADSRRVSEAETVSSDATSAPIDYARSYPPPCKLPPDIASRTYLKDLPFRLTELPTHPDGHIRGIVFERCTIHGPGVLDVRRSQFTRSTFISEPGFGYPDSLFYELDLNREWFTGLIVIWDCVFRDCTFVDLGIAGRADKLQIFRDLVEGKGDAYIG